MSLFSFLARKTFALAVVFCLSTALSFTGCKTESEHEPGSENTGFVLEGVWTSPYDSYVITKTTVAYIMDNSSWGSDDGIVKGSIEEAVRFSNNAGVLIIKVTEAEFMGNTVGYFTGVYYCDGTETSIKIANAFNADFTPVETSTLADAKSTFTVDHADNHVTMYGSYKR